MRSIREWFNDIFYTFGLLLQSMTLADSTLYLFIISTLLWPLTIGTMLHADVDVHA